MYNVGDWLIVRQGEEGSGVKCGPVYQVLRIEDECFNYGLDHTLLRVQGQHEKRTRVAYAFRFEKVLAPGPVTKVTYRA